jgi:hypothetical protein
MQTSYDKLTVTRDAMEEYINSQQLSTAVQAEKNRGFDEIDRSIQDINDTFTPIKAEVYKSPGKGDLNSYTGLSGKLGSVYAQINQALEFLVEIRK